MYREFFHFRERPFGKTPNPDYLYESPQHREALARLEYAVEENDLALLVGDIGSGKTTLSRALIDRVSDTRTVILLINPRMSPTHLLRALASGLGLTPKFHRNDLLEQIHGAVYELHEAGKGTVLIIDEAQLIPRKETFDEIRLLTNFQLDDQNLLSVILIGQPELEKRLAHHSYAALRQRIGIRYSLGPLDETQTQEYISHRIHVAGGNGNPFTLEAMRKVYHLSGGIPRLINTIATTALLEAFGDESPRIDEGHIARAAAEHRLAVGEGV